MLEQQAMANHQPRMRNQQRKVIVVVDFRCRIYRIYGRRVF